MNRLAQESSPYLLQHASNPVDWYPWGDVAWSKAKKENKLVLVSVGYSACHWCHVMEKEVFENHDAASYMNAHFVCIKVDREERPDVDHLYMLAVQLMTQQGGWPLNCFCLPDGRPVYGGTYFPIQRWTNVLESLIDIQKHEFNKLLEYAQALEEGIADHEVLPNALSKQEFTEDVLHKSINKWRSRWDLGEGGTGSAPKFPMPNNIEFLLSYGSLYHRKDVLDFAHFTLTKMAMGGIYDQIGGGFSRYSVDSQWKVPHFEKMLYDNAQLITVYSMAYRQTKNDLFEDTLRSTLEFIAREMTTENKLFFSALDADSEGVEGKFYSWTEQELKQILADDFPFFKAVYGVGNEGLWEKDISILLRPNDDLTIANSMNMPIDIFRKERQRLNQKVLSLREKRIRPALDHKVIASWNALMIKALADAFKALSDDAIRQLAIQSCSSFVTAFVKDEDQLWHNFTNGQSSINGFLDDYAFAIEAFLSMHEITGEEWYMQYCEKWMSTTLRDFSDDNSSSFWFTSKNSNDLFSRKKEMLDNVIPSANSSLCKSLFILSHLLEKGKWEERSDRMLGEIIPSIDYAPNATNWLTSLLWRMNSFYEVAILGPESWIEWEKFNQHYIPNCFVVASTIERSLPIFEKRLGKDTAIYVCHQNTCSAPVQNAEDAMRQMNI